MTYKLNLPIPDSDSKPFWDGTKRRELLIQRCQDCGKEIFPPQSLCPSCLSSNREWKRISGKGEVYSFVTFYFPPNPLWRDKIPFITGLIDLEDTKVRMISNIVDIPPEKVKIGMKVEVVFEDVTEEITLPKFRPVSVR